MVPETWVPTEIVSSGLIVPDAVTLCVSRPRTTAVVSYDGALRAREASSTAIAAASRTRTSSATSIQRRDCFRFGGAAGTDVTPLLLTSVWTGMGFPQPAA